MQAAQVRNGEATRNAILDAAEAVFSRKGFADTATSQIAAEAGVTKSLIHHHFGSKQNLWKEVTRRRFGEYAEISAGILTQRDSGELAALAESMRVWFHFLQRNPAFVRLHNWANAEGSELGSVSRTAGALTSKGVEAIRALQKKGRIRKDVDAACVVVAFFCLVERWFNARDDYKGRFGADYPSDQVFLDSITKILLKGIAP